MAKSHGWLSYKIAIVLLWLAAAVALGVMAYTSAVGWDAQIYWRAVQDLGHGQDPYAKGIAEQLAFQNRPTPNPAERVPLAYVYSPLTLPLLRVLSALPGWLLGAFYSVGVAAGFLLALWAGFQMAEERERKWLALLLPAVAFFPALVTDDVILSGNISFVLYGLILAAAVPGWKRGRWFWYYVAVVAASVVKTPMLTMLAFPVLVGRRQWVPAAGAAAAGVGIFAVQASIWPQLFREYLFALRLVFDEVHDFGFGPAGILSKTLWQMGRPYSRPGMILYLLSACVVAIMLLALKRRVALGKMTQEAWIPVALVGTLLFYPRIMKYDLAAFTIAMLLIAWRALGNSADAVSNDRTGNWFFLVPSSLARRKATLFVACFLAANIITVAGPPWVPVELMVLLAIFGLGVSSGYLVSDASEKSGTIESAPAVAEAAPAIAEVF